MKPFDYIYYRICKFYLSFGESGPWAFGIPAMAMSHYFVLVTLDKIFFKLGGPREFMTGTTEYFVMGLIFFFNFLRYKWFIKFDSLQIKWYNENKREQIIRGTMVSIYLLGSLLSMLYWTEFFNRKIN